MLEHPYDLHMVSLAEIARFTDPEEAFCAQGYLRSCGVETYMQNEHLLATAPHMRIALNGYGLFAYHEDAADEAREALRAFASPDKEMTAGALADGEEIYTSRKNWFWLPTFFFFGAWPFIPRVKSSSDVVLQGLVLGMLYFFMYMIFLHPLFKW